MFHQSMIAGLVSEQLASTKDASKGGIFELPGVYVDALIGDKKYLVLKGGRGSGKTFAALATAIEDSYEPIYKNAVFLVMRELIGNLDDTENTLLDIIDQAGLSDDFRAVSRQIRNKKTGCRFIFRGARSNSGKTQMSQINKLKGIHNVKRVIIEEAQDMSEETLNVLLPTVNRSGKIKIKGKDLEEAPEVRWIFCMNPNLKRDPVIEKVETQSSHQIVHANIFDIEERFQDAQLLEQAKSEEGEIYYDHVWLGKEFYKISGFPFASTKEVRTNEEFESYAFLDPSFSGGDYTALSFIANRGSRLIFWGYCWREGWNTVKDDIVAKLKEHNAISFIYESNALADTPQELFALNGIDAVPHYSIGNKHNRIYRGAAFVAGRIEMAVNKCNAAFVKNVLEYSEDADHDDAPDSLVSNLMAHGLIDMKKVG